MERIAKEQAYSRWMDGQAKLLVGRGAISVGMDYPYIRRVWHCGFTSSNINFIQKMGQAERDGEGTLCTLIYSSIVEQNYRKLGSVEFI
jgi:superfamily II DNA helicase RecQ